MVGVRLACYAPPTHPPLNNCAPCPRVTRYRTAPPTPSTAAPCSVSRSSRPRATATLCPRPLQRAEPAPDP
eukprot:3910244-Prymnesium_polylepis.1